jgi:hypothetical protein
MSESPIRQTMDDMLGKLGAALLARSQAEKEIAEYGNALRALAKVMEDRELGDRYLARVEELSGKPGFADSVRNVLRFKSEGLTPTEIRAWIGIRKLMDLSAYTNPLASIHTTLRRMRESAEVEEFTNGGGQKAYRFTAAQLEGPKTKQLKNLRAKMLIDAQLAKES